MTAKHWQTLNVVQLIAFVVLLVFGMVYDWSKTVFMGLLISAIVTGMIVRGKIKAN